MLDMWSPGWEDREGALHKVRSWPLSLSFHLWVSEWVADLQAKGPKQNGRAFFKRWP